MNQTPDAGAPLVGTLVEVDRVFNRLGRTIQTVLVVEDEADTREMMQLLLEGAGYAAFGAANGREALEFMRQRQPSVVLFDLNMPVMDGWEFRRQQREDEQLSAIPVICVTANYDPVHVATGLKVRCIAKPICLDDLLGEIASACR
jgi:CheY-like chemotaxis protein